PEGQGSIRQQARAERTGIHHADAFVLQIWNGFVGKSGILKGVLIVTEHAVDLGLIANKPKDFLRITAETDEAHLSSLLCFPQRRNGFVNDLLHFYEFDVVAEDDVQVIGSKSMQAHIHAFTHSFRAKIEVT